MNNIIHFPHVHRNLMSLIIPHSTDYVILTGDTVSKDVGILENTMDEAPIKRIGASFIGDYSKLTDKHRMTMGIFLVNPLNVYAEDRDKVLEQALLSNVHKLHMHTPTDQLRLFRHWQKYAMFNSGGLWNEDTVIPSTQYPFSLSFGRHRIERFAANGDTTLFGYVSDLSHVEEVSILRTALMLLPAKSVVICTANSAGDTDNISIQVFSGVSDSAHDNGFAELCMKDFVAMAADILHGLQYARDNCARSLPITGMLAPSHFSEALQDERYSNYGIIDWNRKRPRFLYSRRRVNGFLDAVNDAFLKGQDEGDQNVRGCTEGASGGEAGRTISDRSSVFGDNFEPYKWVKPCDSLVFLLRKAEERGGFTWRRW